MGGALPPGLTLDPAAGLISGTPTAAGTFDFQVRVASSGGSSDQIFAQEDTAHAAIGWVVRRFHPVAERIDGPVHL